MSKRSSGDSNHRSLTEARELQERLQLLFDRMPIGCIVWDTDFRVQSWNAAAAQIFGFSAEEAIGKHPYELIVPKEAQAHVDEVWRRLLEGDMTAHSENENTRKDGRVILCEWLNTPLKKSDGRVVGVLSMVQDITERKRSEVLLRESEKKYRQVVENATEIIYSTDERGNFTYANPAALRTVGYSLSELRQLNYLDLVLPEHRKRVSKAYIQHFVEKKATSYVEFPYRTKPGEVKWFGQNASLITEEGKVTGFHIIARDITERKRAEEALRESEKKLRQVVDLVPHFIFAKDAEGQFILANKAVAEAYGTTVENLLSHKDADFAKSLGEARHFREDDLQVVRSGQPKFIPEESITDHQGNVRILQTMKIPFFVAGSETPAVLGVAIDITERKGADARIREQAALLDITQDAVIVRDLEHRILYWNNGAERMYGWSKEEAIGTNALKLLYRETPPQFEEVKKSLFEKGEWRGELHPVTKDGKEIIVEARLTLMRDDEGKPKSILFVNTDITERKKLEAQFLRAQRMESIGTLAGGIAHDLNNVLAPILMAVEVLKKKHADEQSQRMLATLQSSAKHGADLVKQVLTFARGVEGERVVIQISHLIREMEKIAKETFPKSIEICTELSRDLWTVSGDATQLHQVLMNLCVNARDAMPKGGTLTIAAENVVLDENYARMHLEAKAGPYVVGTVTDTGSGIPPEIIDKIFEPFFTTKTLGKGTGLGLATVAALVKSHGGFVNVYTEVNKGTSFKVYLPATETTETRRAQEEVTELPSGHGELVLVVDDEASIRDITKETLEAYGYQIITASDGTEAVALYVEKKGEIRVVLTDMMMPYLDGPATIRALQKIDPQVKIVLVSGLAEKAKVAEVAESGIRAFLSKPYTAEQLLRTLHNVLTVK